MAEPLTTLCLGLTAQDWAAMSQHRIENENLKMQLEAYKNEVELLKHEVKDAQGEDKDKQDKQIRALQQALQGMQQVHTQLLVSWGFYPIFVLLRF